MTVVGTLKRAPSRLTVTHYPTLFRDGAWWLASVTHVEHIGGYDVGYIGGLRVTEGSGFGRTKLEAVDEALTDYVKRRIE